MKQLKKVLIIAHIFPPIGGSGVQRTLKFVKYLETNGWQPTVVTVGNSKYPFIDQTLVEQIPKNIEVIRFDEPDNINNENIKELLSLLNGVVSNKNLLKEYLRFLNENKEKLVQLVLPDQYLMWANVVLKNLDKKIKLENFDLIYSTSGPYSDHIIGYYLKEKHNKPWVIDIRDEWSNNPYFQVSDKGNIFYKTSMEIESEILRKADKVVTTTPLTTKNYIDNFNLDCEKVNTITNGYDEEDFINLEQVLPRNKRFTMVHNGLFYSVRTPETILRAIHNLISKKIIEKNLIKMVFTWSEKDSTWLKLINELNLEDVVDFKGYLNHKESLELANQSDALLLVVGPDNKDNGMYPGKMFEYLRFQKPIISLAPSGGVVEKIIDQNNRGQNVDFHNIEGIEEAIFKYYKKWLTLEENHFPVSDGIKLYERKSLTKELTETFDESIEVFNKKQDSKKNLKKEIEETIDNGNTERAKDLSAIYIQEYGYDMKVYSWLGIISILENDNEGAIYYFQEGLKFGDDNMDLHYNLGYSYLNIKDAKSALIHFKKALNCCTDATLKNEIKQYINQVTEDYQEKQKLVFFSIHGGDKFLQEIINGLKEDYEIRKIIVTDLMQVEEGMKWADICWFDWCDKLLEYGSSLEVAKTRRIICRLHRYEVFTTNPEKVIWENIDRLIFVSNHIYEIAKERISLPKEKISIIPNGINQTRFEYRDRKKGYNLAVLGHINMRKNPMLILHYFHELLKVDSRYKLYFAGDFSGDLERGTLEIYMKNMVKKLGLEKKVFFDGFIENKNLPEWLADKNYLVTGSISEGHPVGIMEGMSCGLKPVVHAYPGIEEHYPIEYSYKSVNDFIEAIKGDYSSQEYYDFIKKNYSLEKQLDSIKNVLLSDVNSFDDEKVVEKEKIINIEKVQEFYDDFIDHLKKDRERPNQRHEYIKNRLKKLVKKGDRVLDLGCGIGITTEYISRLGVSKVIGVDLSPKLINFAKSSVKDVEFLVNDITNISLDEKFDVITLCDVVEHIPRDRYKDLFSTISKHLTDSGIVYITVPDPQYNDFLRETTPEKMQIIDNSVTLDEIFDLCKMNNLKIKFTNMFGVWLPNEYNEYILVNNNQGMDTWINYYIR
ncbi:glycosyltransferase [Sutcliffiella horikoshii]|uniref:glycosyltransferase n=1 Tax=Sutcliffiella horikoshii TaxID=79883 RepID=UPI001CFDB6D9|nr:glycosyltransferase [Sutcliffiella horikoshii]